MFGNRDKFMYIIKLFFKKFNKYFIECNKINKYNNSHSNKIKSYKIKVLRKIKNLKKYFYFNTRRNKGLRLFSYLNTFSVQYHVKHLLWHSPYSYLLLKKSNIFNNINPDRSIFFSYRYKYYDMKLIDEIEKVNDTIYYCFVFNILLNVLDIKEE
jgi:hypothetical protein